MAPISRLFHDSGGLVYHLRAWRWRDTLWRAYHAQVAAWLRAWRPRARHLVLIGPSGGYALSTEFLARFAAVTALEPDPLARIILRHRFPGVAWRFAGPLADPADLPAEHPDAAFLFCNLLGQAWRVAPMPDWQVRLEAALRGREWASFHDVASTDRPPDDATPREVPGGTPFDAVIGLFWRHGEISVEDHETHDLCPRLPRAYVPWQLRPGRFHLVAWLRE
jgi:hypothetical protein